MMRGLYISALVIALAMTITSIYYGEEVSNARSYNYLRMLDSMSYGYTDSYNDFYAEEDDELTIEAGWAMMGFMIFFLILEIMTFVLLKTKTMLVLNIIGISFTGIWIVWDIIMIGSPSHISFDETFVGWVFLGLLQIGIGVPGTIHAFRKKA